MAVIRAEPGARREEADAEAASQYVFTITDGGFAKRTRIGDYRLPVARRHRASRR